MEELRSVVIAAQAGDHDAFSQIVDRFQNMAYAGAYAMLGDSSLAQDAAQEAFIDAYLSLSKLREPAAFPGWFRRLIIKHSDRQIRRKRVPTVPVEMALTAPSPLADPLRIVELRQTRQTVHEAIAALPQGQRLATILFYVQGYSQKEIAQFLELPVTTIKKRLYTARQKLKERMLTMLQDHLQENRPSQTDEFRRKVQFFTALRSNDLEQVKKLVAQTPDLVHLTTTWDASSQSYYWPLGVTPLYWAAGAGYEDLLTFLLSQGADVNGADPHNLTPLHHAVLMRQIGAVRRLLDHGANIAAQTKLGYTPLHYAAMRDNKALATLLLDQQADLHAVDDRGYTPTDWAALLGHDQLVELLVARGATPPADHLQPPAAAASSSVRSDRQVPASISALGRLLNGAGQPLDHQPTLNGAPSVPIYGSVTEQISPILETGIKIVDLMTPLKRGGHNAIFTPLSGVGLFVLINQLMYRFAAFHDGYLVSMGLEDETHTAQSLVMAWRGEFGLSEKVLEERMVHVFGKVDDSLKKRQQVAETGLTLAEDLRQAGHDVLLVVDSRLALTEGVLPYLRSHTVSAPTAAITTLYRGQFTLGIEPEVYAGLDAMLTFDLERAGQRLYPALDPLKSYATLLASEFVGETHAALAQQIKTLFRRYQELHYQVDRYGLDSLFYLYERQSEEQTVLRARRLHRFLTQPFFGAEPWTGLPGQYVSLADTLQGCQAILAGETDSLPEEALSFIGTIDQAK